MIRITAVEVYSVGPAITNIFVMHRCFCLAPGENLYYQTSLNQYCQVDKVPTWQIALPFQGFYFRK